MSVLLSSSLLVFKDVGRLEDTQNRLAIKQLIKEIGEPRNYGLTDEEKAEEERRAAEERLAKEAMEEAERQRKEAAETAEKIARWEEWVSVCTRVGAGEWVGDGGWGLARPFRPLALPIRLIEKCHGNTPNKFLLFFCFCLFCHMYHFFSFFKISFICTILKKMPQSFA